MILIVDSGATRAEWVVIDDYHIHEPVETIGFNPYFSDQKTISEIIEKGLVPYVDPGHIREIYYYGAGCSTQQKCNIVEDALLNVFHKAHCELHHDLLGAARALFGKNDGIACILGTGSNSCYYDGKAIKENVASLGYLFGDEGSGAYLGKLLLTDILKGHVPHAIRKAFELHFDFTLENILDAVYNQPHPNRFLASFASFLGGHKNSKYVRELIKRNFEDFLREQVNKYKNHKTVTVGVVGSIGFHFGDTFRKIAGEQGLKVGKIEKSPIEGLVKYHLS